MNKLILSILICFILVIPTKAYSISGSKWLEMCKEEERFLQDAGLGCTYYLVGLLNMKQFADRNEKHMIELFKKEHAEFSEESLNTLRTLRNSVKLCVPKEVSPDQLKKIMTQWLEQYPEKLHLSMSYSFFNAMLDTFPCKN